MMQMLSREHEFLLMPTLLLTWTTRVAEVALNPVAASLPVEKRTWPAIA